MTQRHDQHGVMFAQGLQSEQILPFAFPVVRVSPRLDAVLPTPTRVASVAGQKHRTCWCAGEIGDMARSMSRGLDCKQRTITEHVDHPFEFPIRIFRELELPKCRPSFKEVIL